MFGPLGLLLAGPAVDGIGVHAALLISALVVVLASAAALTSRGVRQLRWRDAEPADAAVGAAQARSVAALDAKPVAALVDA
jgi:hypothetical protein